MITEHAGTPFWREFLRTTLADAAWQRQFLVHDGVSTPPPYVPPYRRGKA